MAVRVNFFEIPGTGEAARLFSIHEIEGRLYVSGSKLADAIIVLKREVTIAERRISRADKPLDWIDALPLAYERDALVAATPEREDQTLESLLLTERTLVAWRGVKEFFAFDSGTLRDAEGHPVSLKHFRQALSSGPDEWELMVPVAELLEALSPNLPVPSMDELSSAFYRELLAFQREYGNWIRLYREPAVWDKVLFGTPAERIPTLAKDIDRGLFGRVGARFYPRIERDAMGADQLWRIPRDPGGPIADAAGMVVMENAERKLEQRLLDLSLIRVPTKILLTRMKRQRVSERVEELEKFARRNKILREGERLFLIIGPDNDQPDAKWHAIKADPDSGHDWLFIEWD
ncbi:MAG: hypothetical protein KDH09_04950 [Chrysiogenetes bacterium]|nr:hypothetical protein [Chrysiogenetes bacterium]